MNNDTQFYGTDKLAALVDNTEMTIYKRHWFPPEIISYAVWFYVEFWEYDKSTMSAVKLAFNQVL
mgnify:CR=1 FL=1